MPTAVADLDKAFYEVVTTDEVLRTILAGKMFYDAQPPQGSQIPYINLGTTGETIRNVFNGAGNIGTIRLHIWATSRKKALEIYKHLNRLLNRVELILDDNVLVQGETSLNTIMRDPDRADIIHASMIYSFVTKEIPDVSP